MTRRCKLPSNERPVSVIVRVASNELPYNIYGKQSERKSQSGIHYGGWFKAGRTPHAGDIGDRHSTTIPDIG